MKEICGQVSSNNVLWLELEPKNLVIESVTDEFIISFFFAQININ